MLSFSTIVLLRFYFTFLVDYILLLFKFLNSLFFVFLFDNRFSAIFSFLFPPLPPSLRLINAKRNPQRGCLPKLLAAVAYTPHSILA